MGQDEPGLNRLIRAAFKLLGLQTYFTAGVKGNDVPECTPPSELGGDIQP